MENPTPILEKLEWNPIRSGKANPEAIFKCDRCSKETLTHPNYRKFGIVACVVNRTTCYKIEEVAQRMIEVRGWKYVNTEKKAKNQIVSFICEEGHEQTLTYENLRKGCGCINCKRNERWSTPKAVLEKIVRTECACRPGTSSTSRFVCPHYNHKIDTAGGAEEWDYTLNDGLIPEDVSPSSGKDYWYRCPNEWCRMPYQQSPNTRQFNVRCPFCTGRRACEWNCFATNFPEICKDLDPDNTVKPTEVTPGSAIVMNWICNNHGDVPFKYQATVLSKTYGHGCSMCNVVGYKQRLGGKEVFVEEARKIHGDKYLYNNDYLGSHIPMKIYCPAISKSSGIVHGDFMQTPDNHKHGQSCPKCSRESTESKLIKNIKVILAELKLKENIDYILEHKFSDLISRTYLKLDFYLPKYNLVIEGDGQQHFEAFKYENGEKEYEEGKN